MFFVYSPFLYDFAVYVERNFHATAFLWAVTQASAPLFFNYIMFMLRLT